MSTQKTAENKHGYPKLKDMCNWMVTYWSETHKRFDTYAMFAPADQPTALKQAHADLDDALIPKKKRRLAIKKYR